MPRLRNGSDVDLDVPLLGRTVKVDEVVDVPDDVYAAHSWPAFWVEVSVPSKSPAPALSE